MTSLLVEPSESEKLTLIKLEESKRLQFDREKTALKFYLIGKGYTKALKALGFAERYSINKKRKDKVTPEFHHQVRIALAITQLKGIIHEELCIICALLHDVQEDYDVPSEVIIKKFGNKVAKIVWRLTKKFANKVKNKEEYIEEIAICYVASIVKGVDRLDNLFHMINVFTLDKMEQYSDEAEKIFLPMLKTASKLFPEQLQAYHDISQQMKRQIWFTREYVKQGRQVESLKEVINTQDHELKNQQETVKNVTDDINNFKESFGASLQEIGLRSDAIEIVNSAILDQVIKASGLTNVSASVFKNVRNALLKDPSVTSDRKTFVAVVKALDEIQLKMGISALDMSEFLPDVFDGN